MAAHSPVRYGMVLPLFAVASVLLGACQDDAPPKVVVNAPGTTATWRVVVWGAGDQRDPRIAEAIGQELLHRDLAASIVKDAGTADHVLQVTASPLVFPAQESVRDGRDSRLLVQASYRTDSPAATPGVDAASDPARALAVTVALRIAADPLFKPKPPPAPVQTGPTTQPGSH